ncbi:MAG TPA: MobF family relaxase [Acidimicrobiales bacterium]|nr:MobF family relaxase [Acidimicrobiales bacterium]
MLILKPVGPSVAGYYLSQGPGAWIGEGAARLGLAEPVGRGPLRSVLHGCDPATGRYLPRVRSPRRRAGWDLVFAAPKSLSLLAATAPESEMACVRGAQSEAVRGAIDYLQDDVDRGIVAAGFDHSANAGAEPHLHTHVLLANLSAGDEGWTALGKWLHREELAAIYHLGLRHHLEQAGLPLQWRIRPDGMPDLVAVPRAAVRAASTRAHESRIGPAYLGRSGEPRNWRGATTRAGWSNANASNVMTERFGHDRATGSPGQLEARVATQLLMLGSTFTQRDVVVALARAAPTGLEPGAVASWTQSFCELAVRVARDPGATRWTTPIAHDADRRVVEALEARRRGGAIAVLTAEYRRSNFVADAALVSECATLWEDAGITVAVASRNPAAQERWEALTGIEAFHASRRPDVLLVDQAERRPPGELLTLVSAAPDSTLVFIEGGTSPRASVESSLGYLRIAAGAVRADPGPAPDWNALGPEDGGRLPSRSPARLAGLLISRWADAAGAEPGPPVMVGLGVPEVIALNEAGRRHLLNRGEIGGPSLQAWGRSFQAGDRVLAFGKPGHGIRPGMSGTVRSVDAHKKAITVDWPVGGIDMTPGMLGRIGHAYAATPRLASRMNGPVFVLGRAEGLGLDRARVAAEMSVARRVSDLGREQHMVGQALV